MTGPRSILRSPVVTEKATILRDSNTYTFKVDPRTNKVQIRQAVESIRKFGVRSIFVETSVNPKVIRQIAADAGVRIGGKLYSDSMGEPGTAGEDYLGMMRENVLTIVQGLK